MRFFLLIIFLMFIRPTFGQFNLVPNPSFEDTLNCDSFPFYLASFPWFTPTGCTPDYYYNLYPTCGTSALNNPSGYQLPKNGIAYVGLFISDGTTTREYISVQLTNQLVAGKEYYIGFSVSRANAFALASDDIGCLLNDTIPFNLGTQCGYLPYQPQIENPSGNFIADSVNWILIFGNYTALGGEKYLTIGNFKDSANTDLIDVDNGQGEYDNSYYYVDDVFVIPVDSLTGMNPVKISHSSSIFPNPQRIGGSIFVKNSSNEIHNITLTNIEGQIIQTFYSNFQFFDISTQNLIPGVYFLIIHSSSNTEFYKIVLTF